VILFNFPDDNHGCEKSQHAFRLGGLNPRVGSLHDLMPKPECLIAGFCLRRETNV